MLAAAALVAASCASEVPRTPAQVESVASPRAWVVEQSTGVRFSSGYERQIPAGMALVEAGRLPQGMVLRPVRAVFSVEGMNVHEAWLVVDGARLVGFYLTYERAYSPLDPPIPLNLKEQEP